MVGSLHLSGFKISKGALLMTAKRKLPAMGYLGFYHGTSKKDVRDLLRKKYKFPAGTKIVINPGYDKGIYECEAVPPKNKRIS